MTIPFDESYHGLLRQHLGNQRIILPTVRAMIPDEDGRILFVKRSNFICHFEPLFGEKSL